MDIEKRLKQLHSIQPNPDTARVSRLHLLATVPQRPRLTFRSFLTGVLQSGSAMALTGLLLFIAIGVPSLGKFLDPVIGLDPVALHAETQAIKMQIHLADLQYQDAVSGRPALVAANQSLKTGTVTSDMPVSTSTGTGSATTSTTSIADSTSTSTASSTTMDVGQVLKILSQ